MKVTLMKTYSLLKLTKYLFILGTIILTVTYTSATTYAGNGNFKNGKFNFCVSVRFNASEPELQRIRQGFQAANEVLADVTDGQHGFGLINIINNSGASEEAEFWILPGTGRTNLSGRYGRRYGHASLLTFNTSSQGYLDVIQNRPLLLLPSSSGYDVCLCPPPSTALPRVQEQYVGNELSAEAVRITLDFNRILPSEYPEPDVYLTLQESGKAHAVLYSRYSSTVTAVYEGVLPKETTARLIARVRIALAETNAFKPRKDNIITEGDLFRLSVDTEEGTSQEVTGKTGDASSDVLSLVQELRSLWKVLTKSCPSDAYIRSRAIEGDRLAVLLKEGRLRFTPINNFPSDIQKVLSNSINDIGYFTSLSKKQFTELKTYASFGEVYILIGTTGYELTLFTTQPLLGSGAK